MGTDLPLDQKTLADILGVTDRAFLPVESIEPQQDVATIAASASVTIDADGGVSTSSFYFEANADGARVEAIFSYQPGMPAFQNPYSYSGLPADDLHATLRCPLRMRALQNLPATGIAGAKWVQPEDPVLQAKVLEALAQAGILANDGDYAFLPVDGGEFGFPGAQAYLVAPTEVHNSPASVALSAPYDVNDKAGLVGYLVADGDRIAQTRFAGTASQCRTMAQVLETVVLGGYDAIKDAEYDISGPFEGRYNPPRIEGMGYADAGMDLMDAVAADRETLLAAMEDAGEDVGALEPAWAGYAHKLRRSLLAHADALDEARRADTRVRSGLNSLLDAGGDIDPYLLGGSMHMNLTYIVDSGAIGVMNAALEFAIPAMRAAGYNVDAYKG